MSNCHGIHLYHIPEHGDEGDDRSLVPIWSWRGDASGYCGTLYKATSPYPGLWLQGERTTHILEFDVDESGFPMVINHNIIRAQPAHFVGKLLKLQGRKGMSVDIIQGGEIVLNTVVLGKPEATRQLRAELPGLYYGPWYLQDEVKYTDLDEMTGRILIVVGSADVRRQDNIPYARRLCIADLPV